MKLKLATLLFVAVSTVFTIGCSDAKVAYTTDTLSVRHLSDTRMSYGISIFCDKGKGVEYLIYRGVNKSGMNVRLNQNGSVSRCKKQELK